MVQALSLGYATDGAWRDANHCLLPYSQVLTTDMIEIPTTNALHELHQVPDRLEPVKQQLPTPLRTRWHTYLGARACGLQGLKFVGNTCFRSQLSAFQGNVKSSC